MRLTAHIINRTDIPSGFCISGEERSGNLEEIYEVVLEFSGEQTLTELLAEMQNDEW